MFSKLFNFRNKSSPDISLVKNFSDNVKKEELDHRKKVDATVDAVNNKSISALDLKEATTKLKEQEKELLYKNDIIIKCRALLVSGTIEVDECRNITINFSNASKKLIQDLQMILLKTGTISENVRNTMERFRNSLNEYIRSVENVAKTAQDANLPCDTLELNMREYRECIAIFGKCRETVNQFLVTLLSILVDSVDIENHIIKFSERLKSDMKYLRFLKKQGLQIRDSDFV